MIREKVDRTFMEALAEVLDAQGRELAAEFTRYYLAITTGDEFTHTKYMEQRADFLCGAYMMFKRLVHLSNSAPAAEVDDKLSRIEAELETFKAAIIGTPGPLH